MFDCHISYDSIACDAHSIARGFFSDGSIKSNIVINVYIISHTFRNSSLDYEQTIRKLNLGVNCLMYLPVRVCADVPACVKSLMNTFLRNLYERRAPSHCES